MVLFLPLLYSFVVSEANGVPEYFTMIFHICVTRFHDSTGYDMSITIRFTWYETITVCLHLAREIS